MVVTMLIEERGEFEKCIHLDDEGRFYAIYNDLLLHSVYQEIHNQKGMVIGYEALVRLYCKDGSFIPPDMYFQDCAVPIDDIINVDRISRIIHIRNFIKAHKDQGLLFLNMLPCVGERYFWR